MPRLRMTGPSRANPPHLGTAQSQAPGGLPVANHSGNQRNASRLRLRPPAQHQAIISPLPPSLPDRRHL